MEYVIFSPNNVVTPPFILSEFGHDLGGSYNGDSIQFYHDIFAFSNLGGDGYYPLGSVSILLNCFIKRDKYLKDIQHILTDELGMIDDLSKMIAIMVV